MGRRRSGSRAAVPKGGSEAVAAAGEQPGVQSNPDRLSYILRLAEAVSRATDIGSIYQMVLETLQGALGCDRAAVLLFGPDGEMHFKAWRGLSDEYRRAVEKHTPWKPNTRNPQPILVPDVASGSVLASILPALAAEGIRSMSMIPLVYRDEVLGKFVLYYNDVRDFPAEEVRVAETIAAHIAFALGRERAEAALRESQERFRSLVEATSDWIWEVDANGRYTYASPKVRDLLGYEPGEVLGRTPFDLMPPNEAKRVRAAFATIKAAKKPLSALENTNRHKDGRLVVLETSAVPILDDAGNLRGYRGVDRDITFRKHSQDAMRFLVDATAALSSSLDWHETLGKLARLAVPILGDWCVIYVIDEENTVHRAAVACADPEREELARRLMSFPAPILERVRPYLDALRTGEPQFFSPVPEVLLEALATSPEHLNAIHELGATSSMTVPFKARGRLAGLAHFFFAGSGRRYEKWHLALAREVAWRAAVAVDNARLYEEARSAAAARDQFLAVVSHELRNPLAAIMAGVTVLRHAVPAGDDRTRRTLDIVERNASLQARLVDDLLDLSRVQRGTIQLQQAPVSLSRVADAAVQSVRQDAEAAGLTLTFDGPEDAYVQGDYDRLQQVVVNLLTNAVKFTSAPGEVRVHVAKGEHVARLSVSDTGIGLPQELVPHLFEMFHQGEVAGKRKAGLGIGLSLVKAIVEKHGGRVWAESAGPGKGSTFSIELPLVPAPAAVASASVEEGEPCNIVLVEDNADTRAILAEGLETLGHHVRPVASGEEGLVALREFHPDAIVSDIQLPGMDGYEFIRQAHALPGMADVPAFAVTGFGQPNDARRARAAGFSGHFTKPIDVAVLSHRIRESVGGKPPAAAQ